LQLVFGDLVSLGVLHIENLLRYTTHLSVQRSIDSSQQQPSPRCYSIMGAPFPFPAVPTCSFQLCCDTWVGGVCRYHVNPIWQTTPRFLDRWIGILWGIPIINKAGSTGLCSVGVLCVFVCWFVYFVCGLGGRRVVEWDKETVCS
jgi:hypothetical protein